VPYSVNGGCILENGKVWRYLSARESVISSKLIMEVDKRMHTHAVHKPASPYEQIKLNTYTLLFYQRGSDVIKM